MDELLKLSLWAEDIKRVTGDEIIIQDATEYGIRQGAIEDGERFYSLTIDGERYGSVTAYSNGTYYLFSYETGEDIEITL